jgi:hypothetical protein
LEFADLGLRIKEITVHRQGDRRWISWPARPWVDQQGKKQWFPVVEFIPGADREAFQTAAITAIRAKIAPAPERSDPPAADSRRRRPYPGESRESR